MKLETVQDFKALHRVLSEASDEHYEQFPGQPRTKRTNPGRNLARAAEEVRRAAVARFGRAEWPEES